MPCQFTVNQLIQLVFTKKFITPHLKLEMLEADLSRNRSEFHLSISEAGLGDT